MILDKDKKHGLTVETVALIVIITLLRSIPAFAIAYVAMFVVPDDSLEQLGLGALAIVAMFACNLRAFL